MKLDIRLGYNLHPAENRTVKKRKKRCADSISRLLGRKISVKKVSQSIKAPISLSQSIETLGMIEGAHIFKANGEPSERA